MWVHQANKRTTPVVDVDNGRGYTDLVSGKTSMRNLCTLPSVLHEHGINLKKKKGGLN